MKILNFGSLNIDKVYSVENFVKPGETISSLDYKETCGGKGLNQSVSLKKAGVKEVFHAGKVGPDGKMLTDLLSQNGVDISYISTNAPYTGHAVIQVEKSGQNNIILFGGANMQISCEEADAVLQNFEKGDAVLLQNEISATGHIIDKAFEKGMQIFLNPSPITENLKNFSLSKVSVFLMNEIECENLSGTKDIDKSIEILKEKYPNSKFVITLGTDGVKYFDGEKVYYQPSFKVKAVDTTAAGDTFTGYFIKGYIDNDAPENILKTASKASAIAVTKEGAAQSIPTFEQVENTQL